MSKNIDEMKNMVALAACKHIQSNSIIGLGTGSTVNYLINHIGDRVRKDDFSNVNFVCSSTETENWCKKNRISFTELDQIESIDHYFDGADEITTKGIAIKGLGGALTREKVLRSISKKFSVIITSNKLVDKLGLNVPLPVEILKFGFNQTIKQILKLNNPNFSIQKIILRLDPITKEPIETENTNFIIDIYLKQTLPLEINLLFEISNSLISVVGVVETGLFLEKADNIFIGNLESKRIEEIKVK